MKIMIPPPLLAIVTGAFMYMLAYAMPQYVYEWQYAKYAAMFFIVSGLMITIFATGKFNTEKTTINPLTPEAASKLVTDGIFKYSRNPMYLGMLFVLIGWAIRLGNPINVLLVFGLYLYLLYFQIMPEEKALSEKFGDEFTAYTKQTRRWF